jgi:hypothetical protein
MKTIRAIYGKTLRDKIGSDHLRHLSGIQDINKWTEARRREWDAHVGRMKDNRLAKIARAVAHRECVTEADRRKDGRKVSSKPPRPNLWNNNNNNNNN